MTVEPERIHHHGRHADRPGGYVLYWMQASVRTIHNPALEHAIAEGRRLGVPVLVAAVVADTYPESNLRHHTFFLQGLAAVGDDLKQRGVGFVVRQGDPPEVVGDLARNARVVVMDRGYLRVPRQWRRGVVSRVDGPIVEVEGDVVVPVGVASDKREWAARTIRPRILRHRDRFLARLVPEQVSATFDDVVQGVDVAEPAKVLDGLGLDHRVPATSFAGGQHAAQDALDRFVADHLDGYAANRNQPQTDDVSYMSMYLHFGHISPVDIACRVRDAGAADDDVDTYLEELVVRRELAFNYVSYEADYDTYEALPDWSRATLEAHRGDDRDPVYTYEQLEASESHDRYWNAAMTEMRETGYMHNYMRMYWGKKILEWSASPEEAYATTLSLNNRHLLDGRDPNSFTNVAWIFGLHDRPWKERPVFGTVRYMAASGLERKTDPEAYVRKVEHLTGGTLF